MDELLEIPGRGSLSLLAHIWSNPQIADRLRASQGYRQPFGQFSNPNPHIAPAPGRDCGIAGFKVKKLESLSQCCSHLQPALHPIAGQRLCQLSNPDSDSVRRLPLPTGFLKLSSTNLVARRILACVCQSGLSGGVTSRFLAEGFVGAVLWCRESYAGAGTPFPARLGS